ncbi:glycosyltransferase family 4 protein [Cecembia rubra]|uniref:UDP-N-acetylmuramyl pentapeptide phosphotransferase/UDP-N-acetylglucosamine-1-phosphate transferase n=1 Tax=Cecembia rubra TaxID=1485585 RepID=A0A2P8EA36_9BACT|nr:MraY family glycosyltransferase [Cecembia rubra]PSL06328.1 UDP-N-acetylmuramyl pentapeptide phosphotransferase/UDP-N-acetylglucosamine-1-phosphate transferase [Cecembia rubra]
MSAITLFLIALIIGLLTMPILIRIFLKMKVTDAPGGRKIHKAQTPSMGGIVIYLASMVSFLFGAYFFEIEELRYVLAAFTLLFFTGLSDDLTTLSPLQKLAAQCIGGLLIIFFADIRISGFFGFLGIEELPLWLSYLITFIVIIALTNAFNLVDGLDGLAGTLSLLNFSFFAWWFMVTGNDPYSKLCMVFIGAVVAFLVFNWQPAKIFMGDTGSLSIGFILAVLTVLFIDSNGKLTETNPWKFNAPIASGIALMIIPIYDTSRVFIKRIRRKKSPFSPDKSHVHHFLLRSGLSHGQVVLLLGFIKLIFFGLIISTTSISDEWMIPIIVGSCILLGLRLDAFTLSRVRYLAKKSPPVLALRSVSSDPSINGLLNKFPEEIKLSEN